MTTFRAITGAPGRLHRYAHTSQIHTHTYTHTKRSERTTTRRPHGRRLASRVILLGPPPTPKTIKLPHLYTKPHIKHCHKPVVLATRTKPPRTHSSCCTECPATCAATSTSREPAGPRHLNGCKFRRCVNGCEFPRVSGCVAA